MRAYGVKLRIIAIFGVDNLLASELLWNAVPAKSKGYSAWLKSISYSISYSIFGGNRSSTRFLPGKIVLLLDFFYSFTEKRNRSFTRSPTPIFHFVKSIFTVWHSHTQGGLGQGITCAHFADSACMNLPSHKIMEFLEISTR